MELTELGIPSDSTIPLKHAKVLRGPFQMSLDITNRCNFRCLHCYNRSGENPIVADELSDEELIAFAHDVATFHLYNFCFCGGEPLLRKDLICTMAKILVDSGSMISFVSNGSLMTLESGISRAQVSLDGARAESYERLRGIRGSFDTAVAAIEILRDAGFKDISVAFCPTNFNCSELEEAAALARSLGVNEFRVQPLMILGRTKQHVQEIVPSPQQYREVVRTIENLRHTYGQAMTIEWGDPVDHLIRFPSLLEHCNTFLGIKANGAIEVSPYLPITIGSVRNHKLSEYWDRGLARMWEIEEVKKMAQRVSSVEDMGKQGGDAPDVWYENDIALDLIDDGLISKEAM
jgi:MoaA/NifB/PqqE/SkfB family radical SAM enzyme